MDGTNLAAVLHGRHDLRMENIPLPDPGENEVQLRPMSVGVCGTDVHLWQDGAIGDFFTLPMILGHECSGVVSKVGPNVNNFKPGDRIAVEPFRPCRTCEFCTTGHYNVCTRKHVFYGTSPHNGALAQRMLAHTSCVYKLPDNVSFEEGALLEPLSVALYALRRVGFTLGDSVLICGAGTIGLCTVIIAKALGAAKIMVTETNSSRLERALDLGASHTYLMQPGVTPERAARDVRDLLGDAPNKAIECSAAESAMSLCIHALKACGTLGLLGLAETPLTVPVTEAVLKDLDIKAVLSFVNTYPTVIDLVSRGAIDVKPLITNRFSLKDTPQALEVSKSGSGIKVIVECNTV